MPDQNKSIIKFTICVAIAASLWMMDGLFDVSPQVWHILSVFIGVIASFIIRHIPWA